MEGSAAGALLAQGFEKEAQNTNTQHVGSSQGLPATPVGVLGFRTPARGPRLPTNLPPRPLTCLPAGQDFFSNISRARFEELCMDLFQKCMEPVVSAGVLSGGTIYTSIVALGLFQKCMDLVVSAGVVTWLCCLVAGCARSAAA